MKRSYVYAVLVGWMIAWAIIYINDVFYGPEKLMWIHTIGVAVNCIMAVWFFIRMRTCMRQEKDETNITTR